MTKKPRWYYDMLGAPFGNDVCIDLAMIDKNGDDYISYSHFPQVRQNYKTAYAWRFHWKYKEPAPPRRKR